MLLRRFARRTSRIVLFAVSLLTPWALSTPALAAPPAVGTISTLAGTGVAGFNGDLGAATSAQVNSPFGVAVDVSGNVYIADTNNHRIRKVAAGSGAITTVAGTGVAGFLGDGGAATSARLYYPKGVAVNAAGDLFVADQYNHRIRKISGGVITTVAGSATGGYGGDGGVATAGQLYYPYGVAVDSSDNLYIADTYNHRTRKVAAGTAIISTVAGNGSGAYNGDGVATGASLYYPTGVAVDAAGNVYIADQSNERVRKVNQGTGIISTVAGTGSPGFDGEAGIATSARLYYPEGVAVDAAGNVYIADYYNDRIRKLTVATGVITTVAGSGTPTFGGDGGLATAAQLYQPSGVAVDAAGSLYIADEFNNRVRNVSPPAPTFLLSTFAGTGTAGYNGDGAATGAQLYYPTGTAVDLAGNVYIADQSNHRVRKVAAATGLISTIAGTGVGGYSGEAGPATSARLNEPEGVTTDAAGNLYIADMNNQRVRKVAAGTGIITTVAGNGVAGYSGDGAVATAAQLYYPTSVAVDGIGNLYIADRYNHRIRKVATNGIISTVAGTGTAGVGGDGGAATLGQLNYPQGVAVDIAGNLYIADNYNHRVRKVTAATGVISTMAGTGTAGYLGEAGPATSARLYYPAGVAVDAAGNVFIADSYNQRIRMVGAGTGIITTVAGTAESVYGGDGGAATAGQLNDPYGVAVDAAGTLYIADTYNQRVRRALSPTACIYDLSATTRSVGTGVLYGYVDLTSSGTGCYAWTATSNAAWLTVVGGGSGAGNGTVTYSVAVNNTLAPRIGTIYIAGLAFTVTQAPFSAGNSDVNGDGSPDLVWRNTGTGTNVVWYLSGTSVLTQGVLQSVPDPAWQLVATADLNADGHPDAIWRNTTTGANVVWYLNGTTILGQDNLPPVADLTWQLVASADVNRDGSPDLIWRNQVNGATLVWYLSGVTLLGQASIPTVADLSWTIAAAADMNADGSPDLIWRNVVSGANVVWYLNGVNVTSQGSLPAVPDLTWTLAAALDVYGDGRAELFWRNRGTGANVVWSLSGLIVTSQVSLPSVPDTSWHIAGPTAQQVPSDLNGDQHPDLVWRNTSNGNNVVWYLNGTTLVSQSSLPSVPDLTWQRVATADLNGDGHPDLIWRNSVTGANVVWLLNGTALLGQVSLPSVPDLAWQLVTTADINDDAQPDLIWRNSTTGANVVWYLNGTTVVTQGSLPSVGDPAWRIAAAADMNGDGHADLIWRNTTTGANVVWYLSGPGAAILSQAALQPVGDPSWQIAAAADVNGDSHPDLIWRNTTTGANVVWFLSGTTLLSQASLQSVPDTSWVLRP